MFNFKKKVTTQPNWAEPSKITTTTEAIEKIHREFNTAGERLLLETKAILDGSTFEKEDKAKMLHSYGFKATKEAEDYSVFTDSRKNDLALASALNEAYTKYPIYKFITKLQVERICEKYGLVVGEVGLYKGFVPEKNLKDIHRFFEAESPLNTAYSSLSYHGMMYRQLYDKKTWETLVDVQRQSREHSRTYSQHDPTYEKRRVGLLIAAPEKEMKTEGKKRIGNWQQNEIPDPVVLAPATFNGIELYCIVTAWGDEASDELVVNQQQN